jgi:hypothetical protein
MTTFTRCKVLIPERILKEKATVSEQNFIFLVRNYLVRYPNYQFIDVENRFAVCDRMDEEQKSRGK